jgi:hypothetical protein
LILYVNGDSHSFGHDAGGPGASYGKHLADKLKAKFVCQATAGGSNSKILRTTREYLKTNTPNCIVIGWSTWEREEWLHNGQYFSVNGSGHNNLPKELQQQYKNWLISKDHNCLADEQLAHQEIWALHLELIEKKIPHLFFNCYLYFENISIFKEPKFDWNNNYLDPYGDNTYWNYLNSQGFKSNNWHHFGADAHRAWANYLYPQLTKIINESIITK